MAGATWNCCHLGASSVHTMTIQPCTLLAEWPGSFTTAVTRGWNGYRNMSQHRKSTLEKKILPPLLQGFEPATFQSRDRCSNHWAIPAHWWHSFKEVDCPYLIQKSVTQWCYAPSDCSDGRLAGLFGLWPYSLIVGASQLMGRDDWTSSLDLEKHFFLLYQIRT